MQLMITDLEFWNKYPTWTEENVEKILHCHVFVSGFEDTFWAVIEPVKKFVNCHLLICNIYIWILDDPFVMPSRISGPVSRNLQFLDLLEELSVDGSLESRTGRCELDASGSE
jgi:hypothetical protein